MIMWFTKYHIDESHFGANEWCLTLMDEFHSSSFIFIHPHSLVFIHTCRVYGWLSSLWKRTPKRQTSNLSSSFVLFSHCAMVLGFLKLYCCSIAHTSLAVAVHGICESIRGWLAYAKRIFIGTRSSTATRFDASSYIFDLQTAISGKNFCFCFSRVFSGGGLSWWSPKTELEIRYGSRRLLLVELFFSFFFEKFAVKFAVRMVPVLLQQQQQQI